MQFWHNKKVFITGHTGFKGSWLSLWLQQLGANVIGYALNPPTTPSLFHVAQVEDHMTSLIGDIRDFEKLKSLIAIHKPEIIFHMAAQPLVRYAYTNPIETYATNVMGTVHLLEAVRQIGNVAVVINVTSDKCYENNEWHWGYRENDPLGGYDPYSNSKACAELVTSAYRHSYFNKANYQTHTLSLASARAGNVIGGGDWAKDRLMVDLMCSFMTKQPVLLRNPQSIRPWQHVLEPLAGYLQLAEYCYHHPMDYAEAWNFGPNEDDAQTVQWIAEYVTKLWGEGSSWQIDTNLHPHEAKYLKLDCAKTKARLQWRLKLPLQEGLSYVVNWYKAFQAGQNMHEFTLKQIRDYND